MTSEDGIAEINPIRYKGYYYDQETNLYYCKSRYYSPEICRWISRDEIEYLDPSSITGCNLYVYCHNNPMMYVDEEGTIALWVAVVAVVAITAIAIVAFKAATEIKVAEEEYSMKAFDFNLSEESITFDDEKIYANEIPIGTINGDSFEIYAGYKYSRSDMEVICKSIANHMGKPDDYKRLYYEWEAHNYGYYAFQNDGLMGKINSAYGSNHSSDLFHSCIDVNFGLEKETGIRGAVLLGLRFFGNFPIIGFDIDYPFRLRVY